MFVKNKITTTTTNTTTTTAAATAKARELVKILIFFHDIKTVSAYGFVVISQITDKICCFSLN